MNPTTKNVFLTISSFVLASNIFGQNPFQEGPTSDRKDYQPKAILRLVDQAPLDVNIQLEKRIELELNEVPFEEFQSMIRDEFGISLLLHDSATDGCITQDELITCKHSGGTLAESLELILSEFEADFVVQNNVIKITSKESAFDNEHLIRQTFDIRPLVNVASQSRMESYKDDDEAPKLWELQMIVEEDLLELLSISIDPDSWSDAGGQATVSSLNGILVIRQSRRNMKAIASLLNELLTNLNQ